MSYHNEQLVIVNKKSSFIPLEGCEVVDNKLICKYKRKKLLEIMSSSQDTFSLLCFNNKYEESSVRLVKDIKIIYNNIKKEDLFVGITKPIETNINMYKFIVYETNITDVTNFRNGLYSFGMNFEEIEKGRLVSSFTKYENIPLLLICYIYDYVSSVTLQNIYSEIILNDINIKYNFRIQPVNNIDTVYMSDSITFLPFFSFPKILDFTSEDYLTLFIYGEIREYEGIKLNKDSNDLECEKLESILRCIVPKNHFKGKKSGYYSLVYVEDSQVTTFYEIPSFEVVLNETEPDIDTNIITVKDIKGHS